MAIGERKVKPKKRWGQHFLRDLRIARRIVAFADVTSEDMVLEIGPGTGVLTQFLMQAQPRRFVAVEIDPESVQFLRQHFGFDTPDRQLLQRDILSVELAHLGATDAQWKLIGNLPYYLSSEILFWMFRQSRRISQAVVMVQREVAERLVASVGSKQYGVLSIAAQSYAEVRILLHVPPSAFTPPPKVSSSVVLFRFQQQEQSYARIQPLVRQVFQYRRKKLLNALEYYVRQHYGQSFRQRMAEWPPQLHPFLAKRPEQLSPEDYHRILTGLQQLFEY